MNGPGLLETTVYVLALMAGACWAGVHLLRGGSAWLDNRRQDAMLARVDRQMKARKTTAYLGLKP